MELSALRRNLRPSTFTPADGRHRAYPGGPGLSLYEPRAPGGRTCHPPLSATAATELGEARRCGTVHEARLVTAPRDLQLALPTQNRGAHVLCGFVLNRCLTCGLAAQLVSSTVEPVEVPVARRSESAITSDMGDSPRLATLTAPAWTATRSSSAPRVSLAFAIASGIHRRRRRIDGYAVRVEQRRLHKPAGGSKITGPPSRFAHRDQSLPGQRPGAGGGRR